MQVVEQQQQQQQQLQRHSSRIAMSKRLTPAALQSYRLTRKQVVNEKSEKDGMSPVLAAATNGHVDVVRCLVKNGANIDDTNPEGQTPLILAAKNGYWPLLRLLVNYGARLDVQDAKGRTALMYALAEGSLELARCLIDAGASQKPIDKEGKSALFVAAECGHVAVVEHLMMDSSAGLNARDRQGRTVLMMLARVGKAWPVHRYFKESQLADMINEQDATGRTPLLHAVEAGKFSMAGRLVAWGADTTARTADQQTVVMLACQRQQLYCASADADFGAASDVDGDAEAWDQKSFVAAMVERGVALDAVDKSGRTALFYAVEFAEMETVRHVMTLQASLLGRELPRDGKSNTVLHTAARAGRKDMVQHLVGLSQLSGLVDEPNAEVDVPLRLAVMSRSLATVRALIDSGASLETADKCREPPLLCLASEYGAEDVVAFLLERGFDPDAADSEGVTALMAATRGDHIGIVERLLKASADVNLFNKKGFTALAMAVQSINIVMCTTLLNHKANPNLLPDFNPDCKTLCSIAATLDHCPLLDTLLEYSINPFTKDRRGRNALYYSVLLGRLNALKFLMKSADPDDVEEYFPHEGQQHTLLNIACEKGNMEAVKLLLLGEPAVEQKSSTGEAPLHVTCRRQDVKLTELLITYTIQPDLIRDSDEFTPLMIASQLGNKEIVRVFCVSGSNVNWRTREGYTALILAVSGDGDLDGRVSLVNTLLDYGAELSKATDKKLVSKEAWKMLKNLYNAKETVKSFSIKTSTSRSAKTASSPAKEPQTKHNKPTSAMTVEERLKMKLKKRSTNNGQKAKQSGERKKDAFSSQTHAVREEARISADATERNIRRLATVMKKHIQASALPEQQGQEDLQTTDAMNHDIERIYRKSFRLSYDQACQNKLLRDFSTRMDQLRKETVRKFEEKLDDLCRSRPEVKASAKGGGVGGKRDKKKKFDAASSSIAEPGLQKDDDQQRQHARRRHSKAQCQILYKLKAESKATKPVAGFRPALVKRLNQLAVPRGQSQPPTYYYRKGQACRLSGYWNRARRRKVIERHFVVKLRLLMRTTELAADDDQQGSAMLSQFSLVRLDGLGVAVDEATVWWAPLPALAENSPASCSSESEQQTASIETAVWPAASRRPGSRWQQEARAAWTQRRKPALQQQKLQLRRTLAQLAIRDCVRPSILIRCCGGGGGGSDGGRSGTWDVKLAMERQDRQHQAELSWAIQFQLPLPLPDHQTGAGTSRRHDALARLSVDPRRCLWDPRELRALSAAFALRGGGGGGSEDGAEQQSSWERQRSLDALTRRQTYWYRQMAAISEPPQEMESVALHQALSAKLVATVLHARLAKACTVPWAYHGDDVLLQHQPNAKELKRLTALLGPNNGHLIKPVD